MAPVSTVKESVTDLTFAFRTGKANSVLYIEEDLVLGGVSVVADRSAGEAGVVALEEVDVGSSRRTALDVDVVLPVLFLSLVVVGLAD